MSDAADLGTTTEISRVTLSHYEREAEAFWRGTRDHNVSQNIEALISAIAAEGRMLPFRVLDFGCGPGRDLVAFKRLGHDAIGLDGAPSFVHMARTMSGCEVWQQDFLALDLPESYFDGIFANASLFHVPEDRLPAVLRQLHAALRPRGILFASNPRGENQRGWRGERYGCYWSLETWAAFLEEAGFRLLHHYYRPPGLPRERQLWLATVSRRE